MKRCQQWADNQSILWLPACAFNLSLFDWLYKTIALIFYSDLAKHYLSEIVLDISFAKKLKCTQQFWSLLAIVNKLMSVVVNFLRRFCEVPYPQVGKKRTMEASVPLSILIKDYLELVPAKSLFKTKFLNPFFGVSNVAILYGCAVLAIFEKWPPENFLLEIKDARDMLPAKVLGVIVAPKVSKLKRVIVRELMGIHQRITHQSWVCPPNNLKHSFIVPGKREQDCLLTLVIPRWFKPKFNGKLVDFSTYEDLSYQPFRFFVNQLKLTFDRAAAIKPQFASWGCLTCNSIPSLARRTYVLRRKVNLRLNIILWSILLADNSPLSSWNIISKALRRVVQNHVYLHIGPFN